MPHFPAFRPFLLWIFLPAAFICCVEVTPRPDPVTPVDSSVVKAGPPKNDTPFFDPVVRKKKQMPDCAIIPDSLLAFSKTLIGIPYLYASTDPAKGFDCSGFITYVFNHFNCAVPRSSVDFTNYGKDVELEQARPGDLILFTGTDSTIRVVGHMGIVEHLQHDTIYFIHSSSGKNKGVVITPMGNYYKSRFVKVIRVFRDEFFGASKPANKKSKWPVYLPVNTALRFSRKAVVPSFISWVANAFPNSSISRA